jgi:hypothetical protein
LTEDFGFWLLLLAVGVAGGGWLAFRWLHIARLIEDTPTSRVRSAAQGYTELSGRALPTEDEPLTAPLTGRPCVWWRYRVQKRTETRVGGRKKVSWQTINADRSSRPFLLDDETGRCLVLPDGAEVRAGESTTWYGHRPWPTEPPLHSTWRTIGGRKYRYFEARIYEHERVYVLGQFRTHSQATGTRPDDEVRALLAEWKADQHGLQERFDQDNDGTVSLAEWELARAEAKREVEQRRLARPAAAALHTIGRPEGQRLFLIAAFPEGDLAKNYRRKALFAFLGFVLAAYALGWLLQGVLR